MDESAARGTPVPARLGGYTRTAGVRDAVANDAAMDTSRISQGEMIAGIGGLGLFLFLFLDWFGPLNAWQTFDIMDVVLAIIGIGVAVVVAARAAGNAIDVPGGAMTIALAGFAATCIVLTFLLESDGRKFGIFLELVAALAIAYGGWQAMKGSRTRTATPPPAARTDTTIP